LKNKQKLVSQAESKRSLARSVRRTIPAAQRSGIVTKLKSSDAKLET